MVEGIIGDHQKQIDILGDNQQLPRGGGFCPGKLTLGKIPPGKNSVPELKNGGKNSVPSGFGRIKRKFGTKRRRNFWLIFLVHDWMKLNFP